MLLTVLHFVRVSSQSTLCPSPMLCPGRLSLVNCIFKFPLLTVLWLGHTSGRHWQVAAEWSKRPQYLFPDSLFLLYRVSGSSCMPAGHCSKVPDLSGLWKRSCLFSPRSDNVFALLLWGLIIPYPCPQLCKWSSFISLLFEIFKFS